MVLMFFFVFIVAAVLVVFTFLIFTFFKLYAFVLNINGFFFLLRYFMSVILRGRFVLNVDLVMFLFFGLMRMWYLFSVAGLWRSVASSSARVVMYRMGVVLVFKVVCRIIIVLGLMMFWEVSKRFSMCIDFWWIVVVECVIAGLIKEFITVSAATDGKCFDVCLSKEFVMYNVCVSDLVVLDIWREFVVFKMRLVNLVESLVTRRVILTSAFFYLLLFLYVYDDLCEFIMGLMWSCLVIKLMVFCWIVLLFRLMYLRRGRSCFVANFFFAFFACEFTMFSKFIVVGGNVDFIVLIILLILVMVIFCVWLIDCVEFVFLMVEVLVKCCKTTR